MHSTQRQRSPRVRHRTPNATTCCDCSSRLPRNQQEAVRLFYLEGPVLRSGGRIARHAAGDPQESAAPGAQAADRRCSPSRRSRRHEHHRHEWRMRRLRVRCRRTRRRHACAREGADRRACISPAARAAVAGATSTQRSMRGSPARCRSRGFPRTSNGNLPPVCGHGPRDCARRHALAAEREYADLMTGPATGSDRRRSAASRRGRRDRPRAGSRAGADRAPAAGARHSDGFGRLPDSDRRDHRRGARLVVRQRRTAGAGCAARVQILRVQPAGRVPRRSGSRPARPQTLRHRADLAEPTRCSPSRCTSVPTPASTAAVPQRAASPSLTQSSISSTSNRRSSTLKPMARVIVVSDLRVTPCRKVESRLRVRILTVADQQEVRGAGLLHRAARAEKDLVGLVLLRAASVGPIAAA